MHSFILPFAAAPRLPPYVVLARRLPFGRAPARRAKLDDRVRRAQASGNPALDGVGTGAFLEGREASR